MFTINKRVLLLLFPLMLSVSLFGCAGVQKPLAGIVPGRTIDTLQSAISITAKSGEHSTGGRGYLVYRAPQLFHLALLSPFGQALLDAYSDNVRFTALVPDRQTAYTGLLSELPEGSALSGIGLLKWVMAPPPLAPQDSAGKKKLTVSGESFHFDGHGLLQRKVSSAGDEVAYLGYRTIGGIAFPETVTITNRYGVTIRIVFEDPEVNVPVEGSTLTPDLSGMRVLPLADFKGL